VGSPSQLYFGIRIILYRRFDRQLEILPAISNRDYTQRLWLNTSLLQTNSSRDFDKILHFPLIVMNLEVLVTPLAQKSFAMPPYFDAARKDPLA
jgi:hypothetical protein